MNGLILALVLLGAPIPAECRVPNADHGIGVCWWSCADTTARQYGLRRLIGIRDAVISDGYGRDDGAEITHILYWLHLTNTKYDCCSEFDEPHKDWFLVNHIRAGRNPIVAVWWEPYEKGRPSCHAIVLTDIYKAKDGHWYVKYYDPNEPDEDHWNNWRWFKRRWAGQAFVLLPGKLFEDKPTHVLP